MPCLCLKCKKCRSSIRNMCKEYHTSDCIDELILRLHYEIYNGFLTQEDINNNTWLYDKRDSGHNQRMMFLVNSIVASGQTIKGLNLKAALLHKRLKEKEDRDILYNSEVEHWKRVLKDIAEEDAYNSFNLTEDKYNGGYEFYREINFASNLDSLLKKHYYDCYVNEYERLLDEFEKNI